MKKFLVFSAVGMAAWLLSGCCSTAEMKFDGNNAAQTEYKAAVQVVAESRNPKKAAEKITGFVEKNNGKIIATGFSGNGDYIIQAELPYDSYGKLTDELKDNSAVLSYCEVFGNPLLLKSKQMLFTVTIQKDHLPGPLYLVGYLTKKLVYLD